MPVKRMEPSSDAKKALLSKSTINICVDAIAFVVAVLLASTGSVLHAKLPHGSGGLTIWGMTRHEWGDVHLILALVFLGVVVIHVIMHWHWISCVVRGRTGSASKIRSLVALLFMLILTAFAVAPFFTDQGSDARAQGHGNGWHRGR